MRTELSQPPELAREAERGEHRLCLRGRVAPPLGRALVAIPRVGQPPDLIEAQQRPLLVPAPVEPALHVLLRPEEQHRASGEADVVPELRCRNYEVREALAVR